MSALDSRTRSGRFMMMRITSTEPTTPTSRMIDAMIGALLDLPVYVLNRLAAELEMSALPPPYTAARLARALEVDEAVVAPAVAAGVSNSTPTAPLLRSAYLFYFRRILPRIGAVVSGHGTAYRYLPQSVLHFPEGDVLAARMRVAGFTNVRWRPLTFGIAALHVGEIP